MKSCLTGVGIVILLIVLSVLGLAGSWFAQGNNWFMYKIFAPKYEQVRRETFEQSKAYKTGMVQELQNMQFKYESTKDEESKAALANIILHRSADFNQNDLPSDLESFIIKLRTKYKQPLL